MATATETGLAILSYVIALVLTVFFLMSIYNCNSGKTGFTYFFALLSSICNCVICVIVFYYLAKGIFGQSKKSGSITSSLASTGL